MANSEIDDEPVDMCLVCGLTGVERKTEDGAFTFCFCKCCGVEFGYGDCRLETIQAHRQTWLSSGAQWFKPKDKPNSWSLEAQLANLPEYYR